MKRLISFIVLCLTTLMAGAQNSLTLGPPFTDHAILQQGQSIPVWGKARKGATVTVIFGKAKAKAKADNEGNWKALLPAQTATFEGRQLTVKAGKEQITLNGVVVGEVWVAAGQSNMEYTMRLYKTFQRPYKGEDLAAVELTKPENKKYACSPVLAKVGTWVGSMPMARAWQWLLLLAISVSRTYRTRYKFLWASSLMLSVVPISNHGSLGATGTRRWWHPMYHTLLRVCCGIKARTTVVTEIASLPLPI